MILVRYPLARWQHSPLSFMRIVSVFVSNGFHVPVCHYKLIYHWLEDMVIKVVNTISSFRCYVEEFVKDDANGIGLLIGQILDESCNIVHLARTPVFSNDESGNGKRKLSKIGEWDPDAISEHAKLATRMLSGGLDIVGVFVILPGDVIKIDDLMMCRTIVKKVYSTLAELPYASVKSTEMILMHISSTNQIVTCKCVDTQSQLTSPKAADMKYKLDPSTWVPLESRFSIDIPINLQVNTVNHSQNFTEQMKKYMAAFVKHVTNAVALVNGELRSQSELLIPSDGKPANTPSSITIHLITENLAAADDCVGEIKSVDCCAKMQFQGTFQSRAYAHAKATVEDAIKALKLDVIRSLYSRVDLHCESFPVVEDEQNASVVHELPFRIFVRLPHSQIWASDYLYPGESAEDSLNSFEEILDFQCTSNDIDDTCEKVAAESDFIPLTPIKAAEKSPSTAYSCNYFLVISCAVALAAGGVSFLIFQS